MTGLLFTAHGTTKLFKFPLTEFFKDGVPFASFMGVTGLLELVGGILIIVGLFTRTTAFVLADMMAVAYFMAHAAQGFHPIVNGGELAIMLCFVFLWLATAGAGPFSLDANRKAARQNAVFFVTEFTPPPRNGPPQGHYMHTSFLIMFLQEQNSGFPTKTVIPAKAGTRLFTRAALG